MRFEKLSEFWFDLIWENHGCRRWSWHNLKHYAKDFTIHRIQLNVLTLRTHWNVFLWTPITFPNANTFLIMLWHLMLWCLLVLVCWNKSPIIVLISNSVLIFVCIHIRSYLNLNLNLNLNLISFFCNAMHVNCQGPTSSTISPPEDLSYNLLSLLLSSNFSVESPNLDGLMMIDSATLSKNLPISWVRCSS